jgi:hypothetical protein
VSVAEDPRGLCAGERLGVIDGDGFGVSLVGELDLDLDFVGDPDRGDAVGETSGKGKKGMLCSVGCEYWDVKTGR